MRSIFRQRSPSNSLKREDGIDWSYCDCSKKRRILVTDKPPWCWMSPSRNSSKRLSALELYILAQPVSNIRSLAFSSLASSTSSSIFFLRVSKPLSCFRSSRSLMEVIDWRVCGRMLSDDDMDDLYGVTLGCRVIQNSSVISFEPRTWSQESVNTNCRSGTSKAILRITDWAEKGWLEYTRCI